MDPPLEKVLKLSVDFSFTSSRAIFRIHARSRQLVVHAQWHLHSPTCVDITTKFSRLNKSPGSDRALRVPLWETIKVVSRQNIIKSLYPLIRNGNSTLLLFI